MNLSPDSVLGGILFQILFIFLFYGFIEEDFPHLLEVFDEDQPKTDTEFEIEGLGSGTIGIQLMNVILDNGTNGSTVEISILFGENGSSNVTNCQQSIIFSEPGNYSNPRACMISNLTTPYYAELMVDVCVNILSSNETYDLTSDANSSNCVSLVYPMEWYDVDVSGNVSECDENDETMKYVYAYQDYNESGFDDGAIDEYNAQVVIEISNYREYYCKEI